MTHGSVALNRADRAIVFFPPRSVVIYIPTPSSLFARVLRVTSFVPRLSRVFVVVAASPIAPSHLFSDDLLFRIGGASGRWMSKRTHEQTIESVASYRARTSMQGLKNFRNSIETCPKVSNACC